MSNAKTKRMKRIFKMQSRKEEQQRAVVAEARRTVEANRRELEAAEAQLAAPTATGERLDLATVQFGRLLVESGLRASAHRRALLDASMADLEAEYATWQAERQRANSLEKMVDRLTEEAAIEAAKAEEALIEELSMSRRSTSHA
ncbi:MAG: hypothetical protein R2733_26250 [Acidimicrobiales bacterium]